MERIQRGVEADSWGQMMEACEHYAWAARKAGKLADSPALPDAERSVLSKIYLALHLRIKALERDGDDSVFPLPELQALAQDLPAVVEGSLDFPIELEKYRQARVEANGEVVGSRAPTRAEASDGGFLLPAPPPFVGGGSQLAVVIVRIDMDDAMDLFEPRIVITLVDGKGNPLESPQETPIASQRSETGIVFNSTVQIQSNIDTLPDKAALFFEFKHYKPKKKKLSTKAFSFLEPDEIASSPALLLEIYKKPTDWKRSKKKLKLLSSPDHALHLQLLLRHDP